MTEQEQVQVSQADRDAANALATEICGCATPEQRKRDVAAILAYRHTATAEALEAMRVMAEHPRWELSCDCWDTGDWQVYSVDGPRSDREWHLIGSGDTPLAALTAAIAKIEGEQP
jgi:hypothetical protein